MRGRGRGVSWRRNLLASATGVGREPSLGFALTVGCGDRNHAASGGMGG